MAKIWFVAEGIPPTGDPAGAKPLEWCVDELGLGRDLWLASRKERLILGRAAKDSSASILPRYVVVEVEDQEITVSSGKGWRSGYYLVPMLVEAVRTRLKEEY
jgi:hypothetical protein